MMGVPSANGVISDAIYELAVAAAGCGHGARSLALARCRSRALATCRS